MNLTLNSGGAEELSARSKRDKSFKLVPLCTVAIGISVYFLLSIFNLRYPGLYYDEALFINAALGGKYTNEFVAARLFGIPVMTMPYIGALKSLIFSPIFALVGVNIISIRLPAILISCLTLFVCYLILKRFVGKWVASFIVFLLCTDPAFVLHTRVDHGPIVMMLLLKLSAIYFFLRAVSQSSWRFLSLTYVCLLLGLWDKLNFAWVIVASVIASGIYLGRLLRIFVAHKAQTILASLIFACGLSFIYLALIRPLALESTHPVNDLYSRTLGLASACQSTLSGEAFCNWVFERFSPQFGFCLNYFAVIPVLVMFALWTVTRPAADGRNAAQLARFKGICFFSILYYAIFFQIVFTPQAGGPHHFMVVWPFHYFVCALAASSFLNSLRSTPKAKVFAISSFIALTAFACAYRGLEIVNTLCAFETEKAKAIWSPSIYHLARVLRGTAYGSAWIVTVDWGIGTQIYALTHPLLRFKYRDLWTMFNLLKPAGREADWLAGMTKAAPIYMVLYAPNLAVFPEARQNLFNLVKAKHLNCSLSAEIKDGVSPCYQVYRVSAPQAPQP